MKQKIDAKMFNAVKIMTKGGASVAEIADYFKISTATISRIRAAESFEDYKQICAARAIAYKKAHSLPVEDKVDVQSVEPADPPKKADSEAKNPVRDYYMNNRIVMELAKQNQQLKELLDYMKLMSNKMSAMLEVWEK